MTAAPNVTRESVISAATTPVTTISSVALSATLSAATTTTMRRRNQPRRVEDGSTSVTGDGEDYLDIEQTACH